jgi:hypothetical protein
MGALQQLGRAVEELQAGALVALGEIGAVGDDHDHEEAVQGLFVQREGEAPEEEEEAVQGLFVQREGEEEEE